MSSIMACRVPPASIPASGSGTSFGVLSRLDRPMDWASRRAGSTVSTTTCRPRPAARRPSAAAVVVFPTPPEPQHTMIRVRGSSSRRSVSSRGAAFVSPLTRPTPRACVPRSRGPLLLQGRREPIQPGQVHAVGDQRKVVAGLAGGGQHAPVLALVQYLSGVLAKLGRERIRHLGAAAGAQAPLDAGGLQPQDQLVPVQLPLGRRRELV